MVGKIFVLSHIPLSLIHDPNPKPQSLNPKLNAPDPQPWNLDPEAETLKHLLLAGRGRALEPISPQNGQAGSIIYPPPSSTTPNPKLQSLIPKLDDLDPTQH